MKVVMMARRLSRVACALTVILAMSLTACGDDDPTGPGSGDPPGDGPFRATVDGVSWSTLEATQTPMVGIGTGNYVLTGSLVSGTSVHAISLSLQNIPGPGTYPLGTGANVSGGTAIYANGTDGWSTLPLTGDAGVITFTVLGGGRAVGTFSFVANPATGNATGTKTITNGSFDVELSGTVTAVPDRQRNLITATVDGAAWMGATVVTLGNQTGTLSFGANDTRQIFNMTLTEVTEPETFDLSVASIPVSVGVGSRQGGGPCCWSSAGGGAEGTVVVETITATRITGTFNFTLAPTIGTDATERITVTDGEFDLGL